MKIQNLRSADFPIWNPLFKKSYYENQTMNLLANSFIMFTIHFSLKSETITLTQKTSFWGDFYQFSEHTHIFDFILIQKIAKNAFLQ
jgi:hypothetical protein